MSQLTLYVKRIRNNMVSGYLVKDDESKLELALQVDDAVYNKLIDFCQKSNYLKIEVSSGRVIDVIAIAERKEQFTLSDTIMEIVKEMRCVSKNALYELILNKHNISEKTLQRELKELESHASIRTDYNNVYYEDEHGQMA